MFISNTPIYIWLGLISFLLLILQILSGKNLFKIPFSWHQKIVWILIIFVFAHITFGLMSKYYP